MLICLAFNTNVVEGLNSTSKFILITPNSSLTINQNEDLELLCEFNEKLTNDGMTQIEYVEWHFIPKRDNQTVIPYSYGILQKNTDVNVASTVIKAKNTLSFINFWLKSKKN